MRKFLAALLALWCTAGFALAQTAITLPIPAAAVADIGNGPIKVRVTQGNASIFTSQGSGVGSTPGSSVTLTLTATPTTPPIVGAVISGSGITSGTTVAAYNGTTSITLSAAMNVQAGTALSWGAACPASAAGIPTQYIQASVMEDYYLLYTQARICAVSPGGPANALVILPVFYDSTTPGGGSSGGGAVSSVFSRTGAVAAQIGDYSIGQVTNGLSNSLTSAFFFVGSAGNLASGVAMSGDCTLTNAGVVICTKTNGVSFAPSATTDTTNASNIASGTLGTGRLPAPFTNGTAKGNTTIWANVTAAAVTNGHVAAWDANGNLVDGGVAGAGTVTSITLTSNTSTSLTLTGNCTSTGIINCAFDLASGRKTLPTRQIFLTGSGTYTTPANALWIRIRMVGGGSSGCGAGSGSPGAGVAGGDTCWNTSGAACTTPVLKAGAAAGCTATVTPGTGGVATGGNVLNVPGQKGGAGTLSAIGTASGAGGLGGISCFTGAGAGLYGAAGSDAAANTGSGSGGGGVSSAATNQGAAGGSAAGCVEHVITSPAPNYTYAIGTGGTAAAAGTNGFASGAAAAGQIIVEEFYNFLLRRDMPGETANDNRPAYVDIAA